MERLTKRGTDGQAMMDCEKCKADWTGKHGKPMADCTALYCRNRLKDRLAAYEDRECAPEEVLPKDKANEIASLKADADALRNKLADTEAALGRANGECAFKQETINVMRDRRYNAEQRANYAESHPWRNLWAWVKRKLGGERNEHVS